MDNSINTVNTWLLQLNKDLNVAVGEQEIAHILHQPDLFSVPKTSDFCNQVLVWNKEIIPVINLNYFNVQKIQYEVKNVVVAILTYKGVNNMYQYGALILQNIPTLLTLKNINACDIPDNISDYRHLFISCLRSETEGIIPVLNTESLFEKGIQ